MGPVDHHVVSQWEALVCGEHLPGVAHGDPVAKHLGHPDQCPGEVDSTKDQHLGWSGERFDEHPDSVLPGLAMLSVVADPAAAGRQLAQGVPDHHTVQALVTQSALHRRAGLARSVHQ